MVRGTTNSDMLPYTMHLDSCGLMWAYSYMFDKLMFWVAKPVWKISFCLSYGLHFNSINAWSSFWFTYISAHAGKMSNSWQALYL